MVRPIRLAILSVGLVLAARAQTAGSEHAKDAQREFAAVFAHPDNSCPWTDNLSFLQCMSKETTFTETHLDAFVAAMRGVATDQDAHKEPNTNVKSVLDELNKTDASWRQYRKNGCSLQYALFGTGTGAGPALAECEITLDRAYMKMLAGFFNLHELA
jgi:hypothetical protein